MTLPLAKILSHVGQEGNGARTLDRPCEEPLMPGTGSRDSPRRHLPALGHEPAQERLILVIDREIVHAEPARLGRQQPLLFFFLLSFFLSFRLSFIAMIPHFPSAGWFRRFNRLRALLDDDEMADHRFVEPEHPAELLEDLGIPVKRMKV